ncbi:hypothetical protein [Nocardioides speluncae]|uniref:hypothetical protein n=1 Tax=Nocardioides speluncae TaxID=2670337 RepID=UPI000D687431|nr:hypothetical protein [Nocardioides speluncae]
MSTTPTSAEHDHSGPDWACPACKPLADVLRQRMTWRSAHWGNLHDDAYPSLARAIIDAGWAPPERVAEARAEERRQTRFDWADHIEVWAMTPGALRPTVELMVEQLRLDYQPFAIARGDDS